MRLLDSKIKEQNTLIDKNILSKTYLSNNSVTATVIFGMPTKDCSYNGICRIEPEINYQENTKRCQGLADIFISTEKQLLFSFAKMYMKEKTMQKHFGSGYFIIIEAFRVPEFISQAITYNSVIIPQGIYKVTETKEAYEVVFEIISRN